MWVKPFHTLLVSIWYHQPQHPNHILSEVHPVSSEYPTHSPHPLICLCPGKLICKASSVYLAFWLPIGFSQQEAQTGDKKGKETRGMLFPTCSMTWCHFSVCCILLLWYQLPSGRPSSQATTLCVLLLPLQRYGWEPSTKGASTPFVGSLIPASPCKESFY